MEACPHLLQTNRPFTTAHHGSGHVQFRDGSHVVCDGVEGDAIDGEYMWLGAAVDEDGVAFHDAFGTVGVAVMVMETTLQVDRWVCVGDDGGCGWRWLGFSFDGQSGAWFRHFFQLAWNWKSDG